MRLTCSLAALAVLLASPALATERCTLDASAYFGGPALEAELSLALGLAEFNRVTYFTQSQLSIKQARPWVD